MRRIIRMFTDLLHRGPIAYAISYVEPDGTNEVDVYLSEPMAQWWRRLCLEDGCAEVELREIRQV